MGGQNFYFPLPPQNSLVRPSQNYVIMSAFMSPTNHENLVKVVVQVVLSAHLKIWDSCICHTCTNPRERSQLLILLHKTAELLQRRPRDAPNIWVPWKVSKVLTKHPATFPEICNPIDTKNVRTKFEVRSFTRSWDNRGTPKIWGVHGFAHAPYSPTFFTGLLFAWTLWIYLPNVKFVALHIPEIMGGTQKTVGSPWIRLRSVFSKIFHGYVYGWTLWMYRPNLQS